VAVSRAFFLASSGVAAMAKAIVAPEEIDSTSVK
jgi:hypothetical protein